MTTMLKLSAELTELLTAIAEMAGMVSGFVQRRSELDAAMFVQTVVLGRGCQRLSLAS